MKINSHKSASGFILITVLIFISLISLLAYQALNSALLETKLAQTVARERFLFSEAQKGLTEGETSEQSRCDPNDKTLCIIFKPSKNNPQEYEITATATQGDMSVTLKSTCMKSMPQDKCIRTSWAQVSE